MITILGFFRGTASTNAIEKLVSTALGEKESAQNNTNYNAYDNTNYLGR